MFSFSTENVSQGGLAHSPPPQNRAYAASQLVDLSEKLAKAAGSVPQTRAPIPQLPKDEKSSVLTKVRVIYLSWLKDLTYSPYCCGSCRGKPRRRKPINWRRGSRTRTFDCLPVHDSLSDHPSLLLNHAMFHPDFDHVARRSPQRLSTASSRRSSRTLSSRGDQARKDWRERSRFRR